jgi:hypothetical protein
MESSNKSFLVGGNGAPGSPTLVRPFFDVLAGGPAFAPVSVPGLVSGSVAGQTEGIDCDSGRFAGAGVDFICNICCDPTCRWDFLLGYRYLTLQDRFGMTSTSVATDGVPLPNGSLVTSVSDSIDTTSRFNGFDIGLRGEWHCDCWIVKATAKIAFGATDEGVDLNGQTVSLTPTGGTVSSGSGFLVRPNNQGAHSSEDFAVVPEFDLTVAWQPCDWLRVNVGYNFLYWSSVARSGGQVDLHINRLAVPFLSQSETMQEPPPSTLLRCTDFWAQGFNAGLEIRF